MLRKSNMDISSSTYLPVTLFEVLDKLHQVCRVSDDFKVELFY